MDNKFKKISEEALNEFIQEKLDNKDFNPEILKQGKIFEELKKENDKLTESYFTQPLQANTHNELPKEMWNSLLKNLQAACVNPYFVSESKKVKAKLLAKQILNKSQPENHTLESIKEILQVESKKYYKYFTSDDPFDFSHTLFQLPFDFQSLVVQYCELLNSSFKDNISITKEELEAYIKQVKKQKAKVILNINDVSLGKTQILSLSPVKALLDVDAFTKSIDTDLAVLEYLSRLIYHDDANYRMKEQYGPDLVDYIKSKISHYPNYIQFLRDIKNGKKKAFFNSDGTQKENHSLNQVIQNIAKPKKQENSEKTENPAVKSTQTDQNE